MTDTLDDLLSRNSQRIWQATWDVIASRDTALLETLRAALPEIQRATADVKLGGMIAPNRTSLEHALAKINKYRSWKCWCDDYPRLLQHDPNREEKRGHVRILHQDTSGWPGTYSCQCLVCGKLFDVEEGEYHSAWWKWRPTRKRRSAAAPESP